MADILSGCYWSDDPDCPDGNAQAGYVYVLAGSEGNNFSEAKPLRTAEDKPLTNVPLSKDQIENYDTDNIEWANICTSQFAVDYDGDGDLDLIVGEMGSKFYVHVNSAESASAAPVFADKPTALDVVLPDQHSNPHLVDWDGDGDLDLLSGGASGSVFLSINEGSASKPAWAEFESLIEGKGYATQKLTEGTDVVPGHGVRVWVTDFNRDGKLDLLTGDATTVEREIPGLTKEKAAQLKKEYDKEMQPIQDEMQKLYEEYNADLEKLAGDDDQEAKKELNEAFREKSMKASKKMMALREKEKLFRDQSMTGHVWVYLQK